MTKREAEMLAKNWRLGNKFRKKSLTKKYDLKTATSGNTGRVKMGIRIDIENNPKDYKAALDDEGNLVFFTGKPMRRVQVSDLFTPPKARKESMINHKLEILKKTFPKEDVSILEQFLDKHDFEVNSFSILETKELFKTFSERTQYQLVALKKDGTELKSKFYDEENDLADMQQKCEDSDEYESTTVLKRIVDVDEDDVEEYVVDNEEEENEAVASIKDRPLVDPRDKEELYKLTTLALKQIPQSPKQKETIKKINVLRKKNGMKPLKASTITADMELKEQLKKSKKSKNKKQKKDVYGEFGTDELTKKYKKVHHMESVNESAILDTIPKMVKGKEKKIATQFNDFLRKKKY